VIADHDRPFDVAVDRQVVFADDAPFYLQGLANPRRDAPLLDIRVSPGRGGARARIVRHVYS
jgi:hypothetical protein